MNNIHQTLEYILKAITPEGSETPTVETRDENGIFILEIATTAEMAGQIIGKEGRIIKSIRTILGAAYPNTRFNVTLRD